MALSDYTISLTTAMILVVMTAALCTSMFAYYQTQNESVRAATASDQPRSPPSPPPKETATRNVHLFWNDDNGAVKFINDIKQNNRKPYGILACIFHPSCGFSKQFNEPFAQLAADIQNVHDDVTVVKIFPTDMGVIAKLFDPINIRGYPTVIGDFVHRTRVIDQYSPQSTSKPFRSVESMIEYIEILKSKASEVQPDDSAPNIKPETIPQQPEPEPQPLEEKDKASADAETEPQLEAAAEEDISADTNAQEQNEATVVASEDAGQANVTKKRRVRKLASHSD